MLMTEEEEDLLIKKNHVLCALRMEADKIKPDPQKVYELAFEGAQMETKLAEMAVKRGEKGTAVLIHLVSASSLMLKATKVFAEISKNAAIPDMCSDALKALR